MIDRVPSTLLARVPPHNLEAEMALLCSVLLDGDSVGVLATLLKPEDFYRTAHRRIYEAMLAVYNEGEPVMAVSVAEALRKRGQLEEVGGTAYISELAGVVHSPATDYYARLVREKALARAVIEVATEVQQGAYEETIGGEALLEMAESRIYDIGRRREVSEAQGISGLLHETFEEIESGAVASGGIGTQFTEFDEKTGGLRPGQLIIVAGRPAMGKSTFALNIARYAAAYEPKKSVLVFSLEMTARSIVKNLLCAQAPFEAHRLRKSNLLSEVEREKLRDAGGYLFDARLYIDDTPALSPTLLRSKARRIKSKHGLDLIVVDYLQLMDAGPGVKNDNRQQEISYISRSLKHIARDLDCPVIALSQLNRMAEQREKQQYRPKLSDLRESGAIEQDADVICLLYRPEYYEKDEAKRVAVEHEAEVIIAKQRNGPTGTVRLHFDKPYMRFSDPVRPPGIP